MLRNTEGEKMNEEFINDISHIAPGKHFTTFFIEESCSDSASWNFLSFFMHSHSTYPFLTNNSVWHENKGMHLKIQVQGLKTEHPLRKGMKLSFWCTLCYIPSGTGESKLDFHWLKHSSSWLCRLHWRLTNCLTALNSLVILCARFFSVLTEGVNTRGIWRRISEH